MGVLNLWKSLSLKAGISEEFLAEKGQHADIVAHMVHASLPARAHALCHVEGAEALLPHTHHRRTAK